MASGAAISVYGSLCRRKCCAEAEWALKKQALWTFSFCAAAARWDQALALPTSGMRNRLCDAVRTAPVRLAEVGERVAVVGARGCPSFLLRPLAAISPLQSLPCPAITSS